jgi:hypothetical protein
MAVADRDGWRAFGYGGLPPLSGRVNQAVPDPFAPLINPRVEGMHAPFVGVTTDGTVRRGLRSLDATVKVDTAPIADAALAFLGALSAEQRSKARLAIDAPEWRTWTNVHVAFWRHGVLLDDLPPATRELGLGLLRATLSARGYDYALGIMELNELVAQLKDDHDSYGQWLYFLSIYGDAGSGEPWGWQIDGHHLCIATVVFDGRIVTTPTFMGSEPRSIGDRSWFDLEEEAGLLLMRSLTDEQRTKAIIHPSITKADMPDPELQNPFDGRQVGGTGNDNRVVPYQGLAASDLSDAQRRLLLDVARAYTGWNADEHAAASMREIESHLDETWFSWYGGYGETDAFYYRVHSPVTLIEFDHHDGVVFDNIDPSRHHIHMLVRTPNGGDYGRDLLAEHHQRFDHTGGKHVARS